MTVVIEQIINKINNKIVSNSSSDVSLLVARLSKLFYCEMALCETAMSISSTSRDTHSNVYRSSIFVVVYESAVVQSLIGGWASKCRQGSHANK